MILAMLGNGRQILYQPLLNRLTGHVLASLLLQQILYRWGQNSRSPFYKFSAPCRHAAYKTGDSWQEEMGFSRTEFETARRRIGIKISRSKGEQIGQTSSLVAYWTDNRRLTWYALNETVIAKQLYALDAAGPLSNSGNAEIQQCPANAETLQQLSNAGNPQYFRNAEKPHLALQDSRISFIAESSSEKTTKREDALSTSSTNFSGKPTDKRSHHPAIAGWRTIARRYPAKQNWD